MKIRNNNREVIRTLAKACYRSNKARNHLMTAAIATTVLVIFCIFSVMKGRIDAEYLMEVRHNGNNASTSLENPTSAQIEKVKELPYVKNIGLINYFANARIDGADRFVCVAADQNAYEKMYLPAYTDVNGKYPTGKNEVMVSIRGLQECGITDPVLGMDITVEIYMDKNKTEIQTFQLSGYYTEYVHPIEGPPIGFFSEEYINTLGFCMEEATLLMIQQKDFFAGEKIEAMLYQDVETKDDVQRFSSENSVNYNVIQRTVGGYDIAAAGILLVLVCAFFLNYNVMNISVNRDFQYYGLLKTLGATNRQIRATIYRQTVKMALLGCAAGAGVSCMMVFLVLPSLLSNYYLNNYGVSSQIIRFQPGLMAVSVCISVLLAFGSVLFPAWRAGRITPVESVKYTEGSGRKEQVQHAGKWENHISHMAWRNVLRNKRTMLITTLSLFVGLSVALASFVITRGLDYTNNFSLFPDFEFTAYYSPVEDGYDKEVMPVSQADVDYFQGLDGVTKTNVIYGDYVTVPADSLVWQSYIKGYINNFLGNLGEEDQEETINAIKENFYTTILFADEQFVKELEVYVMENEIDVDFESFKNGEGAISINGDLLSQKMVKSSLDEIGKMFEIRDTDQKLLGRLEFAGYVDRTKNACPFIDIPLKLYGPDLIVTEAAYEKIGLTKRPMLTSIYVEAEKEPGIKAAMNRFMKAKKSLLPPSEQDAKLPYLQINSDSLEAAQDEIRTMKIAMYAVSGLLIILGLFNYLNATVIGLWGRRREIAVMESIGITRKQLRKMLVLEGVYYSLIVSGLLVTLGSGVLYGIFTVVHSRLGYAKFFFPYLPMGMIVAAVFVTCICVPLALYKKIAKESIIERLRISGE